MRFSSGRATVAVVALTAVIFLAQAPAGAAVPKSKPTVTAPCGNNPNKKLRIWFDKKNFAAENPCADWLVLWYIPEGNGGSSAVAVNVARGSKFNRSRNMSDRYYLEWQLRSAPDLCGATGGTEGIYHGDGNRWDPTEGTGLVCENQI